MMLYKSFYFWKKFLTFLWGYFVLLFKALCVCQTHHEPAALLPTSWPVNAASSPWAIIFLLVSGVSSSERTQQYLHGYKQHNTQVLNAKMRFLYFTDQGWSHFFSLAWSLSAVWGFEPVKLTAVEKDNLLYVCVCIWQCRKGLVMQPLHKYTAQYRRAISIGKDSAVHLHLKEKETLSRIPVFAFWTEKLDG